MSSTARTLTLVSSHNVFEDRESAVLEKYCGEIGFE